MSPWLLANVGAEEPLPPAAPPIVGVVAELFHLLFHQDARRIGTPDAPRPWPPGLGAPVETPVWSWLDAPDGVFAWLNTEEAARAASQLGQPLRGPAPDVVRRVHDKAFAWRVCRDAELEARSLRGLAQIFDPDALGDPEAALAAIRERVSSWPDWTGGRFTLKPRRGGSGRGRVGGRLERGFDEVRGALPRLARQGGALLEPWVEREIDLSAQLHVAEDGTITLLATFEQMMSRPGVYRGHRGRLDHRLRVGSGTRDDGDLLEAATAVARAAHAEGFHGPCGIDAFRFRGPRGSELRPVVELNARFTTGTLVAGLLRRARRSIRSGVKAQPGETRRFELALQPPAGGWPASGPDRWVLPLAGAGGALQPALIVTRDASD